MAHSDIFFPVKNVENPSIAQGFEVVKEKQYAIVGEFDGTEKILHYCADRYELMPNKAIFDELERLFNLNPQTRDFRSKRRLIFPDEPALCRCQHPSY